MSDNNNTDAAAVFSGGPDSTAAALWAKENGYDVELVSYQFHDEKQYGELRSAMKVAELLDMEHTVIDFKAPTNAFGENAQMFMHAGTDTALQKQEGDEHAMMVNHKKAPHLVPFASGVLLSMTASYAIYNSANSVIWGATADDGSNNVHYRQEFADELADFVSRKEDYPVEIALPIADKHKYEILETYKGREDLFAETWSCKEPVGDTQCGTCAACVARRVSAEIAGIEDHTTYDQDEYEHPFTDAQIEDPSLIDDDELHEIGGSPLSET
ncbi:7-cyano-7-deazaguanine synthase [Natrinema pallidum]|uniref:7-cyano-7-deazaguanine synthase n=1 Tax=Natrinema pallidum DSM 3751 TaxID=1227495 RepID=L9YF20_9EURY|nr:7-cyano-7-deazaguanine synthase [Natrinema pallidum]ELY72700.1 ExsB protein [Natrinema pallidum DSM 3751]